MHLFADHFVPPPEADFSLWIPIIAIIVIVLLFIGVLTWLGIRQAAKSRDLEHLQRMKALELGRTTDPSEAEKYQSKYQHNIFWISFWIGAGVPIAATSAASSVILQTHLQDFGIILAIWICVAVISVASVVCATILMISSRHGSSNENKDFSGN